MNKGSSNAHEVRNDFWLSRWFLLLIIITIVSLRAQAQEGEEKFITLQGTAEVIVSDAPDGSRSHVAYRLIDRSGKKTDLSFVSEPQDLSSGTIIRVRGKQVGRRKLRIYNTNKDFQQVSAADVRALTGVRTAIVLKIQSTTSTTSASEAQLAEEVRQASLRAQEHSYGQVSINNDKNGDGVPDVRTVFINQSTAGLAESNAFSLCSQAKSIAAVSGYDHYICIIPPDMNYSWYGQAYIGGTDMVIDGQWASGYPNGLLHEIGHNWGRHHANSPTAEYGDATCIMGGNAGTANRHFNGPQKLGLGWLAATPVGSGTYSLNAVELSSGQRLLTIRDTVANQDLFISFRANIGSYSSGPINPLTTAIHTFAGGSSPTVLLANLGNGQNFSRNGITITQVSNDGQTAQVAISTTCVASAPLISLSPRSFATNSLSSTSYSLLLTNKDTNCSDPTTFQLGASSSNPSLVAALSSGTVVVSPGQSASVSLTASASVGLPQGIHTLSVNASAAGHPSNSDSVQYVYDAQAPSTPLLSGSVNSKRREANLSWQAVSDAGGAGVSLYRIYRNGALLSQTSGTSFTDSPGTGTFSYQVQAVDGAGNAGLLSSEVSLTIGSRPGKR